MKLSIKVMQAQLTRDTDVFTDMDPYVIVKVGSQSRRTRTIDNGGKKPVWNENFVFQISEYDNTFSLTVMDKDTFTADDLVGSATINLLQIKQRGGTLRDWLFLDYRGTSAGKIEVEVQIMPDLPWQQLNQMGNFMQGIGGISRGLMPIPGVTPVPPQAGIFGGGSYTPPPPTFIPQAQPQHFQTPGFGPAFGQPAPPQNVNYPPAPMGNSAPPFAPGPGPMPVNQNPQVMNQQMAQALVSAGLVSPFLLGLMNQNAQFNQPPPPPPGNGLPPGW